MELTEGQLVKFSYMKDSDDAMLGIVTKVSRSKINILWILENHTHTVSYKDFEHALKNGVYEIIEESG
tara:strand:+ start:23 stop:226 length:204 start_codon:yes stop_codon:yes gene_type:complete